MYKPQQADIPYLSVVIPVFNEEDNLINLHTRLVSTLDKYSYFWEVIYVDDGSCDHSWKILEDIYKQDSRRRVCLLRFNRNYGQHMAVFAGFTRVRGQIVATMDADLQNLPEDLPKLVSKLEEGYDVVGGWRQFRQDSWLRRFFSWLVNRIGSRLIGVELKDYGCMLRVYRREIIDAINSCQEVSSFIPALANIFAARLAEIPVGHAGRQGGRSKYNFLKLIKLQFDLVAGFSVIPIQLISIFGGLTIFTGIFFGVFFLLRRLIINVDLDIFIFIFFNLLIFFGIQILFIGLVGEYVGRIYYEVRRRPRFLVKEIRE